MASIGSITTIITSLQAEIDAAKVSRLSGAKWRSVLNQLAAVERSITGHLHIQRSP